MFAAHHANAWEEEREIVFDVSTAPWNAMETYFDIERMLNVQATNKNRTCSVMRRIRINLDSKNVRVTEWPKTSQDSIHNSMDFPMINPKYTGYKKYAWYLGGGVWYALYAKYA